MFIKILKVKKLIVQTVIDIIVSHKDTVGLVHVLKDDLSDSKNPVTKLLDIPIKGKVGGDTDYMNSYDIIVFKARTEDVLIAIKELKEGKCPMKIRRFTEEAGFDVVELHFGHGYLVTSFLSPLSNVRTDDYGGDLAGRMKFAIRIATEVRKTVKD